MSIAGLRSMNDDTDSFLPLSVHVFVLVNTFVCMYHVRTCRCLLARLVGRSMGGWDTLGWVRVDWSSGSYIVFASTLKMFQVSRYAMYV